MSVDGVGLSVDPGAEQPVGFVEAQLGAQDEVGWRAPHVADGFDEPHHVFPMPRDEGVEAVVPYRGAVADTLIQLIGGLRSGMSYAGATTIARLWECAEFIRITGAGKTESGVHDVKVL